MMKKLTYVFVLFLQSFGLMSQNSVLEVSVETVCGSIFDRPVVMGLFQVEGTDTTLVRELMEPTAVFGDLDPDATYLLRVSSPETNFPVLHTRDLVVARQIILAQFNSNDLAKFAGDVNRNGSLTTLDLVFLQRHILGIETDILSDRWFFLDENYSQVNMSKNVNEFSVSLQPDMTTKKIIRPVRQGFLADQALRYCDPACRVDASQEVKVDFTYGPLKANERARMFLRATAEDQISAFKFEINAGGLKYVSTNGSGILVSDNGNGIITGLFVPPFSSSSIEFSLDFDVPLGTEHTEVSIGLSQIVAWDGNCVRELLNQNITVTKVPEYCPITWPANVYVNSCDFESKDTGSPSVPDSCQAVLMFSKTDQIVESCKSVIREWIGLNINTEEQFRFIQFISIDSSANSFCNQDFELNFNGADSILVRARDLMSGNNSSALFSFSTLPADSTRWFYNPDVFPVQVYIYEQGRTFPCISTIRKGTTCPPGLQWQVKDAISIAATDGQVFDISARLFDASSTFECEANLDLEFRRNAQDSWTPFLPLSAPSNSSEQIDTLELSALIDGERYIYGKVLAFIRKDFGVLPEISLWAYDDELIEGESADVVFYTNNFNQCTGFQFQLLQNDVEILDQTDYLQDVSSPIYFKVDPNSTSLLAIWQSPNSVELNLNNGVGIFSLRIMPEKSGRVSDFLEVSKGMIGNVITTNSNTLQGITIEFDVNFVERSTRANDIPKAIFTLSPNPTPAGEVVFIRASERNHKVNQIHLFDALGRKIQRLQDFDVTTNKDYRTTLPPNLTPGMYYLSLITNHGTTLLPIVVQ